MAYQAKRKALYTEDFELTEEDGTVVHTLHVALDPDSMAKKLSVKQMDLVAAMNEMRGMNTAEAPEQALEKLGLAVTDVMEAVFGADGAAIIIEFYQERYIEMCQEVIPFITGVVIPKVRKMARGNKKQTAAAYNRKTFFGKK